ncbi:MAG: zinc-ribbon domain-containing protein [Treponema sp.]|jgi:hypothetical protein|nr:zinc-ribbon domain-containing protein [Treponema sp.]
MRTICPNCKTQLSLDTINGSKVTYKCSNCNEILDLSDLLDIDKAEKLLLQPPKMVRVKRKKGLIIVHVPVNLNKISYLFLSIFILTLFSIFLVPFIWSLYIINSNEFAVNIINIILGIVCVILGFLILSFPLRKIFCSTFQRIKIVFSGNNICIYRGLGEKNENIDINFIKKIYSTKSIKEYKNNDGDVTNVDINRNIYIEIENKNTIAINVHDVNEINSLFLILIIKYFSYKKQGI